MDDERKAYCEKNGHLQSRFILGKATGHITNISDHSKNIWMLFPPSNTTLQLKPMDQMIMANSKAYYLC
jgi:hypothetical protein